MFSGMTRSGSRHESVGYTVGASLRESSHLMGEDLTITFSTRILKFRGTSLASEEVTPSPACTSNRSEKAKTPKLKSEDTDLMIGRSLTSS